MIGLVERSGVPTRPRPPPRPPSPHHRHRTTALLSAPSLHSTTLTHAFPNPRLRFSMCVCQPVGVNAGVALLSAARRARARARGGGTCACACLRAAPYCADSWDDFKVAFLGTICLGDGRAGGCGLRPATVDHTTSPHRPAQRRPRHRDSQDPNRRWISTTASVSTHFLPFSHILAPNYPLPLPGRKKITTLTN